VGAPTQVLDSCNYFLLGATQEGVTKDAARRPEAGGYFPHN